MNTLVLVAALAAGYIGGRCRPLQRARNWAWWSINSYGRRHASTPRMVLALVLMPEIAVRAWRHRNDPPPRRAPAPRINGIWDESATEEEEEENA